MKSIPRLSVENPVLVGVLMVAIIGGGLYASLTLVREMFPESRPNQVMITTPYPGASPEEVERGISERMEEAIKDIEHIDKIETDVAEGLSTIMVTMTSDAKDIDQVVNDFKAAVDAIPRDELPEEAEETRVTKFEPMLPVISVAVYGDADEARLKAVGRKLRDELLLLPGITDIQLDGTRKAELTVEVAPERLVEYGVSLSDVAGAIAQTNLDLPGGTVKTPEQNVALRTLGETDDAQTIADTVLRTTPTGEIVRIRDVGEVIDAFEDTDLEARFNGKPSVGLTVFKTSDQDAIDISSKVKAYVAGKRHEPLELTFFDRAQAALGGGGELEQVWRRSRADPLPAALSIETHSNLSRFIEDRLDLLRRNGLWGLLFVFLSLLIFLNWRVAFWVMMGLIVSICGAIMLMSVIGVTLNLITMFGLIVVLGLIVDDAIVVGENVYARIERGQEPRLAAIEGAEEVTWPVIIAVLTTVAAFMPLMFIEGVMGDFMGVLPVVVGCALAISLVESLSILPNHLAESLKAVQRDIVRHAPTHRLSRWMAPLREKQQRLITHTLGGLYEKVLRLAVSYRYVTVAAVLALLIAVVGLVGGRHVPFVFAQKMDSEMLLADVEMPVGTPIERTGEVMAEVEQAILSLPEEELGNVWTQVGAKLGIGNEGASGVSRSHVAQAFIELSTLGTRQRTSEEIIASLRQETASISGVNSIKFSSMQGGPGGKEIQIQITGERLEDLVTIADDLKAELTKFEGVYDLDDSFESGRRELQIELLDSARPLGLTTRYLATEVRGAFYGLEARTLQRNREDVDIRVRFPQCRRTRIHELESMRIVTPAGVAVPFREVARIEDGRGFSAIHRVDQRRAVVVSADVDQSVQNSEQVIAALMPIVADIEEQYRGVRVEFTGNKRETSKSFSSLKRDGLIAVIIIYIMLAGLFKSYLQPLVVLTAIPFGVNGAIAGHFIMGYPLTILSMIGLVALTGIVVNDALILVDFINKEIAAGHSMMEGVIEGGKRRLRPILLTSLTTILGLAPLMTETSFQARFLIPMAISISFGLAFATVLTLIVVPAIYMILADARMVASWLRYGEARAHSAPEPG
jgi:multidrug efflux pump subunit AcrB